MTIYVRDDDVLFHSSMHSDPVKKFKQVHSWIVEHPRFMHRPAILATEIQDFPEVVEFIKVETEAGRMEPQIHGLEHIDYGKLSKSEVVEHLKRCREYNIATLNYEPTIWYTPWGASQSHLWEAAAEVGLKLVDCSRINKLEGQWGVVARLRSGESLDFLEGDEIFYHWWVKGLRLKRVIEVAKHGSWDEAAKRNSQIF